MKHLLFWGVVFAVIHISHSTQDFCTMSVAEGEGKEFIFSVYYDHLNDKCNPFIFKGEGGNANRFQNERECMRNCSRDVEQFYPMDETLACHFKKAIGGCNGQHLRYYYDAIHDKCKKFIWSGCFGNGNRFHSFESCNATCAGIHDDGDDPEEDEPDTPIAIICGVLIGVIVASLCITLIVLTVKSKKKNAKGAGKNKDAKSESPLREQDIEMS